MRKPVGTLAALSIASLLSSAPVTAAGEETFVLRATRIYPAPDSPPIEDGVIVLDGEKLAAVGARNQVSIPAGAQSGPCDAGVVVAGFQNSHVHFTEPHWADAAKQRPGRLSGRLAAMLTRYGFTTALDTGSLPDDTFALRRRIETGEVAGPRILTAGVPLYPHDVIPFYLRDLPPRVLAQLPQPATAEAALKVVRANLDRGADATKLFVATPRGGGEITYMSRDIVRATADETHARRRPVLAHPTNNAGIRLAIESGVDVLVHTTIDDIPAVWTPGQIKDMLAHDIAVVPTLKLWPYELTKAQLAPKIIDLTTADAVEQVRAFAAAGGQVLFGTDVGYMTDYDPTDEYALLSRALSPMQILASLTTAPAARWRESGRRGRIAPGMDADLVVLDGDPAQDARRFAGVRCTFRKGRMIYPQSHSRASRR